MTFLEVYGIALGFILSLMIVLMAGQPGIKKRQHHRYFLGSRFCDDRLDLFPAHTGWIPVAQTVNLHPGIHLGIAPVPVYPFTKLG